MWILRTTLQALATSFFQLFPNEEHSSVIHSINFFQYYCFTRLQSKLFYIFYQPSDLLCQIDIWQPDKSPFDPIVKTSNIFSPTWPWAEFHGGNCFWARVQNYRQETFEDKSLKLKDWEKCLHSLNNKYE